MKQGLRWVLSMIALLLIAAVAVWGASRLWGVTSGQRVALAQMRTEWIPPGRNAFDALWTLQRDVPAAQQRAVVDADRRVIQAWPPMTEGADFRSKAMDFPDLKPSDADHGKLCAASTRGCLAMVSADMNDYAALVERNARLIARADALSDFDYIKFTLPQRLAVPLPTFNNAYAPATRDALLFAQGQQQVALANVCRGIATWRRYAGNTNLLVASMVGAAYAGDGYGSLFAEMLAALPADAPVPVNCREALAAPKSGELSLCEAMKGEFAIGDNQMNEVAIAGGRTQRLGLFFDAQATSAMMAGRMASVCSTGMARMLEQDVPIRIQSQSRSLRSRFACISNAVGCILNQIAEPAYGDYSRRLQDFGMKLKVLGTLLWLRDNPRPGAPLAERLQQRPMVLKSPQREIEIVDDGSRLHIRQYGTSKNEWSQPLRL